jgi:RNA polymerase sigma-70 factor (ECF subfamily)
MGTRTNEEWITDLETPGPDQETALADLRRIVLAGLPYAISGWLPPDDPHYEALAEEVAQETLLRVLSRLGSFEGRSQFTTWVHKIAVRQAFSELRRKRWENVSLESLLADSEQPEAPRWMADSAPAPDQAIEMADMLSRVERIIAEELTEKQRQVLVAVGVRGMPLEEVARRMVTNRNALYKLLHDARLRLKQRLSLENLSPEDILAVFDPR